MVTALSCLRIAVLHLTFTTVPASRRTCIACLAPVLHLSCTHSQSVNAVLYVPAALVLARGNVLADMAEILTSKYIRTRYQSLTTVPRVQTYLLQWFSYVSMSLLI